MVSTPLKSISQATLVAGIRWFRRGRICFSDMQPLAIRWHQLGLTLCQNVSAETCTQWKIEWGTFGSCEFKTSFWLSLASANSCHHTWSEMPLEGPSSDPYVTRVPNTDWTSPQPFPLQNRWAWAPVLGWPKVKPDQILSDFQALQTGNLRKTCECQKVWLFLFKFLDFWDSNFVEAEFVGYVLAWVSIL